MLSVIDSVEDCCKLGWNNESGNAAGLEQETMCLRWRQPRKNCRSGHNDTVEERLLQEKFYQQTNFMWAYCSSFFSLLSFILFSFPFLSLSSLPSCRGWQLTVCSSPVTVYKPRGDEGNYYFKEWEEVREIWVQVMDTSDRYCHPEGTRKKDI